MSDLATDPSFASAPVPPPEIAGTVPAAGAEHVRWSAGTRVAFRFAFCYFLLYALCCGNATIWEALAPFGGGAFAGWLQWPFLHGSFWLGQHLFHLTGVGAKIHGGGSGDRALDWIAIGIMFAAALVATVVWTMLDRRRLAYPTLFGWFRFVIRLALGVAMFGYGMSKVFPLQMAPPSLAVLNEPLGNTSPMTLLWTLLGLNPGYEMVCGAAEVGAGLLILYRRTALLGALFMAFVLCNVVLYNLFFDVPVKIYAAHLLLMALVVIAPDVRSLFRYFWLHQPTAPSGAWVPPSKRRWFRRTTAIIEGWVLLVVGVALPVLLGMGYARELKSLKHPSPFTGEWQVDSSLLGGRPAPYLTGDGKPMTAIFFEPSGATMLRASDQALWRAGSKYDAKKNTLSLNSEVGDRVVYSIQRPDPAHLVLTPTGKSTKTASVLTLTRVALPTHYPLLDRGFHFVNEWGLER